MATVSGFYINLDRSTQRRRVLVDALSRAGLTRTHQRFAAVDGRTLNASVCRISPGEAGCFLSHLGALKAGQAAGGHVHIVEDDAIFCDGFAQRLAALAEHAIGDFDIMFTDMWMPIDPTFTAAALAMVEDFAASGAFGLIANTYAACLASYVVNARSVSRLVGLLEQEVERGLTQPVDLYLADLVNAGVLRVGCVFPYITSVRLSDIDRTTIARPDAPAVNRMLTDAPRLGYFVDADLPALKREVASLPIKDARLHAHRRSVLQLLNEVDRRRRRP